MANEIVQVTITEPTVEQILVTSTAPAVQVTDVDLPTSVEPTIERYIYNDLGLTNMAAAKAFAAGSARYTIIVLDLSRFTRVRMRTTVVTAAALTDPTVSLQYSTSYSTSVDSYADIGVSPVSISLLTTGVKDTGWIDLVSGAKVDTAILALTTLNGNGTSDPIIGATAIEFL